ncbi:MAG: glutaredoxin family protein [Acidimicrobiales bacterium]
MTVLWRPGCGFCSLLTRRLDRVGVAYGHRNIWDDDEARTFLRSNIGCETVPTVLVGDAVLVNPSIDEVMRCLAEVAPHQVPESYEPPQPGRLGRFVRRALGSEPEELAG